ncbi:Thymidylate synthase, partial [Lemmus lemmus]
LQGSTNAKELSSKGVRIWDANGSRDCLDSLGFSTRQEGDLGPVYGFQWRHFGADYKDMDSDYSGQGVDQLQKVIDTIKTNPDDRRIIMCAWNPKDPPSFTIDPLRSFPDGTASLPCPLSVLCSEWGAVLPALPEVRRYGPGRALQHCQLCPAHLHDCTHHRPKGELLSEDMVIANVIY